MNHTKKSLTPELGQDKYEAYSKHANLWKNLLDKFIFIFVNRVCIMMHIIRIVKSDKL